MYNKYLKYKQIICLINSQTHENKFKSLLNLPPASSHK